jgi:hypothetical protein
MVIAALICYKRLSIIHLETCLNQSSPTDFAEEPYFGVASDGTTPLVSGAGSIYQSVTIPSGVSSASLSFYVWIVSDEGTTTAYDFLYVDVLNTSGTLLGTLATYSNRDKSGVFSSSKAYQQKTLSLNSYIGQTVRIRFRGTTDATNATLFRLDDVVATGTSTTGTVRLTVNANGGGSLATTEMNAVLMFLPSEAEFARKAPPSGNPMDFTGIAYGSYFFKVFCWDMYAGASATFSHGSSVTPVTVTAAYAKRPLTITALRSDGVTPLSGATIGLYSWNGQFSQWNPRASGTSGSDGKWTVSAWPTANTGEKYQVRIDYSGSQVASVDPLSLSSGAAGSSYNIITTVAPPIDANDQISEADYQGAPSPTNTIVMNYGNIDIGVDVDMFSFDVTAGRTIAFDVDRRNGSSLDSYLRIFNSSGTQLAFSDDDPAPGEISPGGESYREYTFGNAGRYYVAVSSFNNSSYNAMTGGGDVAGSTTGEYSLIIKDAAPVGNMSARLKKVDATDAPVAGGTPRFVLYTVPPQTRSGANPSSFSDIPAGTYLLEGYQTGTFWGEEFWNSEQFTVATGATLNAVLTRKYPYATSVVMKDVETGATITPGQVIAAGTQVRFEVTVRNDVPGTPLSTQVHFAIDRSQGAPFDYDWPLGASAAQVIAGSGGTALYTFTTALNGFQTGQFHFALEVMTGVGGNVVRTDSWPWNQACSTTRVRTIYGSAPRGQTPTPVFLARYPAGGTAQIDPSLRTWIIIHGRTHSSTTPWVSGPNGANLTGFWDF